MSETTDERIAQRERDESELRERLAAIMFDGPYEVTGGGFDPISAMFGGGPTRYAICLQCAAMVRLVDAEEVDGRTIERSIRIHRDWHEGLDA